MSILSNIFKTAATVAKNTNPIGLAASGVGAVTGYKGPGGVFDPTPGYSATNSAKNAGVSLITGGINAPGPNYTTSGGRTGTKGVNNPQSGIYGGDTSANGYGAGGGSVGTDALLGNLRNQAIDRIHSIQSAYDALTNSLQASVQDKIGQNNQNYDNQTKQLTNTYQDTANQLTGQYQAHGLGDSSYAGNAQDSASKSYNDNLTAINTDRNNTLAQLGQTLQQGRAQYDTGKNSYNDYLNNIGNYGAGDLQTLLSNFGQTQQDLSTQQAGQGTQAQYLQAVQGINPAANQGTSQLTAQLQQLANSSTPQFAKNTIAQGLISQAGQTDPNATSYWQNYFKQLNPGT